MYGQLKKLVDRAAEKGCAILIFPAGDGGYNIDLGKPTSPEKEGYKDDGWLGHGATLDEAIEEALKSTI
jgi:hypothetical protein